MNRRAVAAKMAMKAVAQLTDMAGTGGLLAFMDKPLRFSQKKLTEPRTIAGGIHITRVDTASIANTVDSSESGSTLRRGTRQGVGNPSQSDHVAGVEGRHHEHHGEVSRGGTGGSSSDDESRNGDIQRQGDVEIALASAISMPGIGKRTNDGETVWRGGKEEGLDVAVVQGFDNGREEVGYRSGGDNAQNHEHLQWRHVSADEKMWRVVRTAYQNVCLDISKGKLGSVQEGLLLAVDPVVLANILLQTPGSECFFLFSEPASGTREVGKNEDGNHSDGDSDSTLDDKEPAPMER